jgi:hypothetical protein
LNRRPHGTTELQAPCVSLNLPERMADPQLVVAAHVGKNSRRSVPKSFLGPTESHTAVSHTAGAA